jgi:hypothetical protein
VDLSKLTTSDKVILPSGILLFIFAFLPWMGKTFHILGVSYSGSYKGWHYFFTGVIPVILGLVMVAQVVISRFFTDVKIPEIPVSWGQVHLILGVVAAVLVVLRLLLGDSVSGVDLDRRIGLVLAALAAIALAVGGFLRMQEEKGATPAAGSSGSAPF